MRKWFAIVRLVRPTPWLGRRLVAAAILVGVAIGAFCWGRHGALGQVGAQAVPGPGIMQVAATPGASTTDYQRRVVAYIYDNIPVTREELGEYLIARFGTERVEFLVNRKIVEMQCKSKGIVITDAEIEAQLAEDIKGFGGAIKSVEEFTNKVLRHYNKTLYEWKEDVIRPKLAMTKLVEPTIHVTPTDVDQEFEARYGPRVHCRMIVMQKDDPNRQKVWESVRTSEEAFLEFAKKQFIQELASHAGDIPPIHHHFPDANIEKEAFSLKPGQISSLIQTKDGTTVILRCENHIPPDQTVKLENERMKLSREVHARKLAMHIPAAFNEMREAARPRIMLTNGNQPTRPALSAGPRAIPPPVGN
jgi:hypothetical protein